MTVAELAARLLQSENDNCDAQEALEELESIKAEVEDELNDANKQIESKLLNLLRISLLSIRSRLLYNIKQ